MTAIAENTASRAEIGSNSLPDLAARASAAHARTGKAAKRMLEHALEAGEALVEAQAQLVETEGHGGWLKWLKANCPDIDERKAQRYMLLARHGEQVRHMSDLGQVAALKAIAAKLPKDDEGEGEPIDDTEYAEEDAREKQDGGAEARTVSLDEWKGLSDAERLEFLQPHNFPGRARFNKQTSAGIEWAQWSWNPVTGCQHDCPYCYARDIAEHYRNAFPFGFEPAFRPDHLNAPGKMQVPSEADADTRYRNVFTCSMADLFGRWVPAEWIEAVLDQVRANPQWNFLFLTKFPKRMAEFDIPANAWMGTTVDLQARVANAEAGFARITSTAGVRWLSIEPLLEPLTFKRLDLFQWVVIGGASSSRLTPEFSPPFEWIVDIVAQARAAGARVYFKDNLLGNRVLELPFDAPIKADATEAPAVFHYLGKAP